MPAIWRRAGLVAALFQGLVLSWLMLTPVPAPPVAVPSADKIFHAIVFAALVFPLIVTDTRRWVWAVPLCIAFGGAVEMIQPYVGRTGEWLDFGADVTGVLAGAALGEALHERLSRWLLAKDEAQRGGPEAWESDDALTHADPSESALERMRSELREDLRQVLREEMASLAPHEDDVPPTRPDAPVRPVRH